MSDVDNKVKMIVEGLLLAAGRPLTLDNIAQVFAKSERPDKKELKAVMAAIAESCDDRGFELKEVASGYRFQVKQEIGEWVAKLWEERPPRYTRALLETLALIAYRQPITRGDIEEIRGVTVSPNIIRTLLDREWVRVVGHRDVPGRPALFATTKQFLDYFNIKSLQDLPTLAEIKDLAQSEPEVDLAEELAKQRVIELPDEDSDEAQQQNEQEMAELLAEEAAVELAKKPLDEILNMGASESGADEESSDEESESEEDVSVASDPVNEASEKEAENDGDEKDDDDADDDDADLTDTEFDELDEKLNQLDAEIKLGSRLGAESTGESETELDGDSQDDEHPAEQGESEASPDESAEDGDASDFDFSTQDAEDDRDL